MNILFISPLDYTGISYYTHSLAEAIQHLGNEAILLTTEQTIARPDQVSYKKKIVYNKTFGNRSRILKGLHYATSTIRCCLNIIWARPDIVHFQKSELAICDIATFITAKFFAKKTAFTPHDIGNFHGTIPFFQRLLYKLANIIIVHNQDNKDELIQKGASSGEVISIIPHGGYQYFLKSQVSISEARKQLNIPHHRFILKITGNLSEEKGIFTALESMQHLKDLKDILLVISGKPVKAFSLDVCKEIIERHKLQDNVLIIPDFIPDEALEAHYRCADIILVPYVFCYESGVLRYAFSCGMPIIASDLKPFSEYAIDKKNIRLFKPMDAIQLADRIRELHASAEMRGNLAQEALKTSLEWNWIGIAEQTLKAYSNE